MRIDWTIWKARRLAVRRGDYCAACLQPIVLYPEGWIHIELNDVTAECIEVGRAKGEPVTRRES